MFAFKPEATKHLERSTHATMREPGPHSPGLGEFIATCVCARNDCNLCQTIHGAPLLNILGRVRQGDKSVTADDVGLAASRGATDFESHDTMSIAATLRVLTRCVDGLPTWAPSDQETYRHSAARLAQEGCAASRNQLTSAAS